MANYSTLKAAVTDVVKTNGEQAITGANMQTVLLSIINSIGGGGYIFEGVATPSTNPGTPDQNVFYIGGAGTYANFGTSVVVPPTNIAVFKYNGSWTCEQVIVENGGVFDISAFKAIGGTLATYADLAAALGTGGANVPEGVRKGGMSIKFVQSSDNKYVQYRLMSQTFNTTPANWQGVDGEPKPNSKNLVESGGVYEETKKLDVPNVDLSFQDDNGNAIVVFKNGGVRTKNFDSSKQIGELTDSSADLSFQDNNNFVIVEFKDGHIRTKNFDSRNYTLKPLTGKKYSVVGDSISTYAGYLPSNEAGYTGASYVSFYPNNGNDVDTVDKTWWKIMEKETGLTLMRNCSWSGSEVEGDSTTSDTAIAGCSDRRITDISDGVNAPDIIIVYMGLNDMFKSENLGTWTPNDAIPSEGVIDNFTSAYALMIYKIISSYKNAEVYCCSIIENPWAANAKNKYNYPTRNSNNETISEYNRAIKDICLGLGANFIDIHSCGMTYWNNSETQLGGHPTSKGMSMIGKYVAKGILSSTKLNLL